MLLPEYVSNKGRWTNRIVRLLSRTVCLVNFPTLMNDSALPNRRQAEKWIYLKIGAAS